MLVPVRTFAVLLAVLAALPYAAAAQETAEDGTPYPAAPLVTAEAGSKLDPALAGSLGSSEVVPVTIILARQPLAQVADEVQAQWMPRVRERSKEVRAILGKYTGPRVFANDEAMRRQAQAEAAAVTSADRAAIKRINREAKSLLDEMRQEITRRMTAEVAFEQANVAASVQSLGGRVTYQHTLQNAVSARLPGTALQSMAAHPLVGRVVADVVGKASLNVSVPSIYASYFWNAGLDGGVWDAAICDTGVDTGHPALDDDTVAARTWYSHTFHATAVLDSNYNDNSATTTDLQGHGTHVAGIALSSDSTYRGVAYGADIGINLKAGWRNKAGDGRFYWSDVRAALDWAQAQTEEPEVVNFSAGAENAAEDDTFAQFWDAFVYSQACSGALSAGNAGPNPLTLDSPGNAYNVITVANMDDVGTTSRGDDVIRSSSSRGPTKGAAGDGSNGRKKPDITAPGTNIMSCNNDWETEADFVSKTGTSMAAPHVAGATLLLCDVGVQDPREVKAILINTADDWGSTGWDATYGWGYLNLNLAYLHRNDAFIGSVTPSGTTGDYKLYKCTGMDLGEKATLAWYRRAVYNGSSDPSTVYTLSDLNLRLYDESNNTLISSDLGGVDNVHQVRSDRSGTKVIKVYAWSSSFSGATSETYALASQDGSSLVENLPTVTPSASNYTPPLNAKFSVSVRVENSGDVAAHNCSVTLTLPAGVVLASGSLTQSLGSIAAGSSAYATLELKATSAGAKTVTLSATSSSYAETYTGSGSFTITPGAADTVDPYSVMVISEPNYHRGGTDLITNGGFESSLAGWITSGTAAIDVTDPNTGARDLKLGAGSGTAYQSVTISNTAARAVLTFWYKCSTSLFASAGCQIQDATGQVLVYPLSSRLSTVSWTRRTVDVSRFRGQNIRLNFYSAGGIFGESTLWVDDVTLKENEGIYVDAPTAFSITASDDNSGVDYTQYRIDSGSLVTYSSPFTLSGESEGGHYVYYRAVDNGGNYESLNPAYVVLDAEPPISLLRIGTPRTIVDGTEKVSIGGFGSGLPGWTTSGAAVGVNSPVHSGNWSAKIGGTGAGSIYQDVAVSAGAARAVASAWVRTEAGAGSTYCIAALIDPTTGLYLDYPLVSNTTQDWTQYAWDVTGRKGASVRFRFEVINSSGAAATMYVDDVSLRENPQTYVTSGTSFLIVSGDYVGEDVMERAIDAGPYIQGASFSGLAAGLRTVRYRSLDLLGHQETEISTQFNVDGSGPTGSVQINNGALYTSSPVVTLNLSATDPAGVTEMRIRNSGEAYGSWEAYTTVRSGWNLTAGTGSKMVIVQFRDTLGNTSAEYSDSINYQTLTTKGTIGEAKLMGPHPVGVTLKSKAVTGVFSALGFAYIEETNRSSGVRLNTGAVTTALVEGQVATFDGVLRLAPDGEPEIYLTAVTPVGYLLNPIQPLSMSTRGIGGGAWGSYIPAVDGGYGLHSVGLLVRTWGRVLSRDAVGMRMRIDDGSGSPTGGLLVDTTLYGAPPAVGAHVAVTGDLGVTLSGSTRIPILRVRQVADVVVY